MSMADANLFEDGASIEADVCVVGAGAVGITIARELGEAGVRVVLLESGGLSPDEETQTLYDLRSAGYPIRENFMSRARYYGGSCNLWAGRNMLLEPLDAEARPWVEASGWPIPHAEIAGRYARAAAALRLPPIDRFDERTYRPRMSADEKAIFGSGPLRPAISLWAVKPMRFGPAGEKKLRASANVRVLLRASAVRIRLNADGSGVEAIEALTLGRKKLEVRARAFALACGGIENARLLLVSRDKHANGIGNRHDRVGRFFMDHPRAVFGRVLLKKDNRIPLLRGIPLRDGKVQFGIGLTEEAQRAESLLNHYVTLEAEYSEYVAQQYQTFVQTMKVLLRRGHAGSRWKIGRESMSDIPGMIYLLTPKELMPHFVYRWYTTLRRALDPQAGGNARVVVYFCEQPPDPESRVLLGEGRDALGVPRLELRWKIGSEVVRSLLRMQEILAENLARTGLGKLEPGDGEPRFSDASHHLGTTRMSDDPRAGVVDRDCRVHGVSNLYLAGGSVFPAAGHSSPTLTMIALALRLSEKLARETR